MMIKAGVAAVILVTLLGVAAGLGGFTFVYARGGSYFADDPAACANCHVMESQFDAWTKSSHHAVATCNDCHAPHDSFVAKLWVKGDNGFNHSLAFTTGRFPEPIRIKPRNRAVTEASCRSCHEMITNAIEPHAGSEDGLSCIRCHADVGHF